MKRKLTAVLMVLSILLSMLPGSALAAENAAGGSEMVPPALETVETEDTAPGGEGVIETEPDLAASAAGNTPSLLEVDWDNYTIVTTADELVDALEAGWQGEEVNIRLGADVALNDSQVICGHVNLDLNGRTLSVSPQYGNWSFALAVQENWSSVVIRNGTVACTSADNCTISVLSGALVLEDVAVIGPQPLVCSGGGQDANGNLYNARIDAITRCRLIGDPMPEDSGSVRYDTHVGLMIHSGGTVGAITDTTVTGGYYGILLRGGSIDSIAASATASSPPAITGGAGGIFVNGGTIRSIEGCRITSMGQIAEYRGYFGIRLADGTISSIEGCTLSNILNSGAIGVISGCQISSGLENTGEIADVTNCTLLTERMSGSPSAVMSIGGSIQRITGCTIRVTASADTDSRRNGFGIYAQQSSIGSITGCTITTFAENYWGIVALNDGTIGLVEDNTLLSGVADTAARLNMIQIDLTGTIETLGNNTLPPDGVVHSFGTIKAVTAAGSWDNADQLYFRADGGWLLINQGVIGEPVKVSTEAELLAALDAGKPGITLASDIALSQNSNIFWRCLLDLGGHTLTVHSPGNGAYALAVQGYNVYIRNGTITCPDRNSVTVSVIGGGLDMENVTVTGETPLACVPGTRQTTSGEETVPGSIYSIINCQLIGNDAPANVQRGIDYCGILIWGNGYIGRIENSTITGGYYGILLSEGWISSISNSTVSVSSGLAGACALKNYGEINSLYDNAFHTTGSAAAVRNHWEGTIYSLNENRFVGSSTIYNEGRVENVFVRGLWSEDGKVFHADSGWTLVNSSGEGLIRLDTPTSLTWGTSEPTATEDLLPYGAVTWQFGALHQGMVSLHFYERMPDGQVREICHYNWQCNVMQDNWVTDHAFLLDWVDQLRSGTYFFTVQAVGDYTQYESSGIAVSDDWKYVRPDEANRLGDVDIGPWDGEKLTITTPDDPDVFGCFAELRYSQTLYGERMNVSGSFHRPVGGGGFSMEFAMDENLKASLRDWGPGYYWLRVRAISSNSTQRLNSRELWTVPYYYDGGYGGVEENLGIIANSGNPEEIKAVLNNIGADKLLNAMVQDANVMNSLEELDKRVKSKGVETTVTADKGENAPPEGLETDNISMVGAALNAKEGTSTVELKVGKASEEDRVLPTMYENTITFSMTMEGVETPKELAVPIQITMPVPATINPNFLVILHHRADGTTETVRTKTYKEDGKAYAVFYVTGFSDYTMTEAASGVMLGTLSVQPGEGTISVTTSDKLEDLVQLLVASYDAGGKMLETKIIPLGNDMRGIPVRFTLRTESGGTVKAFAVKDGTLEPVCLAETKTVK